MVRLDAKATGAGGRAEDDSADDDAGDPRDRVGQVADDEVVGSAEDVAEAADDPDAGDEVTGHQVAADRDRADLRVAVERKSITGVAGEDAHPLSALGDRELADGDIRGRRGRRLAARGEGHTRDVPCRRCPRRCLRSRSNRCCSRR